MLKPSEYQGPSFNLSVYGQDITSPHILKDQAEDQAIDDDLMSVCLTSPKHWARSGTWDCCANCSGMESQVKRTPWSGIKTSWTVQRVIIAEAKSSSIHVLSGVPQGSVIVQYTCSYSILMTLQKISTQIPGCSWTTQWSTWPRRIKVMPECSKTWIHFHAGKPHG